MADVRQPGFPTALAAVAAGALVSSWSTGLLASRYPAMSSAVWAILTSIAGAACLKLVLRALQYEIAFAFAAGALLAGRVAGLLLGQAMPDLGGHALPGLPTLGLYSCVPTLLLSTWLVQLTGGRRRFVRY
ncbi:MAG TPA: hypothetical protein VF002_06000 [Gaiellaceae bacterium]